MEYMHGTEFQNGSFAVSKQYVAKQVRQTDTTYFICLYPILCSDKYRIFEYYSN